MYPISESYCTKYSVSKPPLPYLVGRRLTLLSHQPPAPTTHKCHHNPKTAHERRTVDPLVRCLRHPPLPGKDGQDTAELVISRMIRVGDEHSAQVVVVQVTSSSSSNLPKNIDLVAKIYDPLYFDHEQDDADPFLHIDHDYSHETAAYKALSTLQGGIIPKYYGSFTIKMRATPTAFRIVRLILVELIPGHSMRELKPATFSQPIRQTIMKKVVDAESLIYTHNVLHRDMRPANVLICGGTQVRRVVIIDFGKCTLGRHPMHELHEEHLPGVPISPLLRWTEPRGEFESWIDWDWMAWLNHVYESTRASITDQMRELWLPQPEPLYEPPEVDMPWLWK